MSAQPESPSDAHPGRRHLTLLIAPIVAMIVAGYTADALWPDLVNGNPLLLISLSAKNRYLVLVVNQRQRLKHPQLCKPGTISGINKKHSDRLD